MKFRKQYLNQKHFDDISNGCNIKIAKKLMFYGLKRKKDLNFFLSIDLVYI